MPILVLGDFYYGYDYISEDIFELSKFIKDNNYSVILNLEGAITDSKNEIKKRGEHLRQSNKVIEVLKLLNVVGVTLANNHIYDFGEEGLEDTIKCLDKNGIQHTGAGLNEQDAMNPILVKDGEKEYSIFSMTDDYEEAICIDKRHKSGCLKIKYYDKFFLNYKNPIFILHTGFEFNIYPMPRNIKQAHKFIDKGAESVICMHPHLIQPNSIYKNKCIAYSLGNFYFSTFRDEFVEKEIKNKEKGYCNYGYGIEINKDYKILSLEYDVENDKTHFIDSKNDFDFDDKHINFKYVTCCFKNRNNHNPILLGNKFFDFLMIQALYFAYYLYGFLKKLKKGGN